MKFVRIKHCKFEKCFQRGQNAYYFIKNGFAVKLNGFLFLKPHKKFVSKLKYSKRSKSSMIVT